MIFLKLLTRNYQRICKRFSFVLYFFTLFWNTSRKKRRNFATLSAFLSNSDSYIKLTETTFEINAEIIICIPTKSYRCQFQSTQKNELKHTRENNSWLPSQNKEDKIKSPGPDKQPSVAYSDPENQHPQVSWGNTSSVMSQIFSL